MQALALVSAREHLRAQGMAVTQEWLAGCVEFYCENLQGAAYDKNDLCTMVKSQWLLGDLQEISPGCLPPGLSEQIYTTLPDIYALQMISLIDVGTPAYQQLQKILKIDTDNVDVGDNPNHQEIPSQRTLKLILTDGIQTISGLEYKPMRNLNTGLTPGIKLQIKGPVDCRRGLLMLEEKHVTVLGGEVDDLIETNNYKNILCKLVESNTNPTANRPDLSFTREQVNCAIRQPIRPNLQPKINVVRPNNMIQSNDAEEDVEIFNDDNFDFSELEHIENQAIAQTIPLNRTPINNTNIHQSANDYFDLDAIIIDESVSEALNDDNKETTMEIEERFPIKVNKSPYVYIKQLVDTPDQLKLDNTYVVKAQIIKIVGQLTLQKHLWILKCKLCDGSESLDVDFSSDILSPMIGYTPEEMVKLKKQMSTTPELKQKVIDGLENSKHQIRNLNCLFHVLYMDTGPCITKIEPINRHHIAQLKTRLSAVNYTNL